MKRNKSVYKLFSIILYPKTSYTLIVLYYKIYSKYIINKMNIFLEELINSLRNPSFTSIFLKFETILS